MTKCSQTVDHNRLSKGVEVLQEHFVPPTVIQSTPTGTELHREPSAGPLLIVLESHLLEVM